MARKFWERLNVNKIQFYDDPVDVLAADIDLRIAELQSILGLPDEAKLALAKQFLAIDDTQLFNKLFGDELEQIADQRDYFSNKNVVVSDMIDVVDHRWMSPSEMSLGTATIVSFCGEEVANPAINAIDGVVGTNWQHDVDEVHEIIIDLGYMKRIDGIRVRNPASPGNPFMLSGVTVFVANDINALDNNPASQVGTNLAFADPGDNDRDLTVRNGQFIKLTIPATGHLQNHVSLRDLEFRTRPRTFGL